MKVFEKGYIGSLEIKNRILMAPMGTKSDPDGGFCSRETEYFVERAKGGVGMIITGRVATTTRFEMRSHHVLDNYHQIGRLGLLCEKIHIYGSKICVQIGPGLGRMVHQDPFTPPYSASAIPSHYYPELICKPHTVDEIHYLAESVGHTAALAKQAGADAVELHAYGGYLLDQFMSSYYNKRTDEYGGSLKNRMRFTLECISKIQEKCGFDFPLIVKFTADQAFEGGRTIEEGIQIAKMLENAGVHALHVDKGCYECWYVQIPTVYGKDALQLDAVAAVKKAVNIPVIGHGKLHRPELVESVLENQQADFIAMGHQMLCDPYYAKKFTDNNYSDIRPCIGCNECLFESHKGLIHTCAINPQALREADYPLMPAEEEKNVLVIGGGPGGMAAAITAKLRGHHVTLWEKKARLGGNLLSAGAPSFKQDVLKYNQYLINRLRELEITIHTNLEATVDKVKKGHFDSVILACGSRPFILPVDGVNLPNVTDAIQVLNADTPLTGKVVVIGGGLVGCETALHINESADDVTIIEFMDDILATAAHCQNNDAELRNMIDKSKIKLFTSCRVKTITETEVLYEDKNNNLTATPYDTVVMAVGFKTDKSLENSLRESIENLYVIGDAVSPRKIYNAVHEGFHTARLL